MNNLALFNNTDYDVQKNLFFKLGESYFAIPIKNVLEVMKLPYLEYPQELPNNIIGLLKFNNIVINVLDIRFYLDSESIKPYNISNKLIVVKTDESMFAIIADEIENIVDFESSKIERLPFVSENRIIDALYHIDNTSVSILNMYSIEQLLRQGVKNNGVDKKSLMPVDDNSVSLLKERSKHLLEKINTAVARTAFSNDRFVTFSLNKTIYCINLKYIKTVTNKTSMTILPCSPEYIEGLMTIRGDFITIINLKNFLGLSQNSVSNKSKIIVIDSSEFKMGFLVDEIYEILDISEENLENSRKTSVDDPYIYAEVISGNEIKMVLNMEKILSDEKFYIEEN